MLRRQLLKKFSVTAALTSSPLTAMLARSAMAVDTPITRTLFIFHPNGAVPELFFPRPGTMDLPAMTLPMQRVKQHLLFLDSIGYAGSPNTHEGGSLKCLTGTDRQTSSLNSIEVLMGKQDWANRETTQVVKPSLQMGVGTQWGDNFNKRISFDNGQDLHATDDPVQIAAQLFTSGSSNGGSDSADAVSKVLEALRSDLSSLRSRLGQVERERLELHSDALAVLEAKLKPSGGGNADAKCTQAPDISAVGQGRNERLWGKNILSTVSDIQQDLAIQALSCNMTRTIAFSYGVSVSPIVVPGTNTGDHDLSHQNGEAHTTSKIWWTGQIARFIEKMANTPDVNGSLLDNTIVCLVSDLGHGNRHDHYRIPMVLAGGKNAGLVTNRSVDLRRYGTPKVQGDQNANDPSINHSDVLTTISERAGYTSVELPTTVGRIDNLWTGSNQP